MSFQDKETPMKTPAQIIAALEALYKEADAVSDGHGYMWDDQLAQLDELIGEFRATYEAWKESQPAEDQYAMHHEQCISGDKIMKFQPKSEKEIAEAGLWPNGEYDFEVLEAEEAADKNGNDMFKLRVKIFKEDGGSQNTFDYVSGAWMEFKLRHLAEACGVLDDYEKGEIEAYQLVGKTGRCKVNVSKDKTGQYMVLQFLDIQSKLQKETK